ncbi:MAG: protein phosphatase 2C domain-containing protein, partial [Oscillospiraceae bacterium]|nr:protein phosphatase 2C domain-containing protein [Oscillospiraceae bacterium]
MIEAWGITDKGAVRAENQDCYYLKLHGDDLAAAIVCDGMGGHRAGNVASALAVDVASAYLESLTDAELAQVPGEHLTRSVNLANDAVFRRSNQEPDYAGMGTTMVSVIVAGPVVHILNIGDSRAYRISAGGIEK